MHLRPNIVNDPQWSYLESIYQSSYSESTGEWENGKPTFVYHRFWAQVDMATAYAEYERILGSGTGDPGEERGEPSDEPPAVPLGLTATAGDKRVDLDWQGCIPSSLLPGEAFDDQRRSVYRDRTSNLIPVY